MKQSKLLMIILILITALLSSCQESEKSKYERAQSLMAKGSYIEAADAFDKLGGYEESTKLSM